MTVDDDYEEPLLTVVEVCGTAPLHCALTQS